jgi:hypothetical protein
MPSALAESSVSYNQVSLTWIDNSTDETGFEIDMRTSAFGFIPILTVGSDVTSATITGLNPDTTYFFQVIAIGSGGNSTPSGSISITTPSVPQPCIPSHGVLCLNGGRFSVAATYMTSQGQSGTGQVISLTDDTGYFWFFSQANVELVVKVLNGCGAGGHYWVFAGGLTNVEVDLTVIDTTTGTKRTYTNPQGKAFQPIQDTSAFTTCP